LVERGWVYPCRCSRRELAHIAGAPHDEVVAGLFGEVRDEAAATEEALYPGTCRPAWLPEAKAGAAEREGWLTAGPEGRNWRFRIPDGTLVEFEDGGCGPQRFVAGRDFGDFAVWRRDGVPAYQLATVVDDAEMGVTEVVRGADLLLSTARQVLLFQALELECPHWWHCPLVVDALGERLAKRADALSVRLLRERGLSAAAVMEMAKAARVEV
jgi:glutamyl/glutaminyl-tRNA synthetase